jgi:hypothetical protein
MMATKKLRRSARRTSGILAVAVAGALLALAGPASATTTPRWAFRPTVAVKDFGLRTVACTSGGCTAIASSCSPGGCGGLLSGASLYSADDGAAWRMGSFPAQEGDANNVACGSRTFCVLSARRGPIGPHIVTVVMVTQNAGASFAVHVEAAYSLGPSACSSVTSCFVIGSPATGSSVSTLTLRTSTSGRTWIPLTFPKGLAYIEGAACGAPTSCVAVGESVAADEAIGFLSANGGISWKQVPLPPTTGAVRTVNCNGLVCIALGATQLLVSTNGGKSWSVHSVPAGAEFESAACLTSKECVLVGGASGSPIRPAADLTHNGGLSWAPQALPSVLGTLSAVTCSSSSCVAVGDRVTYTGPNPTFEYPLVFTY